MTEFTELVAQAQKQALASIEQAQELWLKGAEVAVGLIPTASLPGTGRRIPSARELVESSYAFTGQMLEQQREYTLRLADLFTEGVSKAPKTADKAA